MAKNLLKWFMNFQEELKNWNSGIDCAAKVLKEEDLKY